MWTGSLGPFIKPKSRQGRRPKRNLQRREARRVVLRGYPIEPRALTKTEIDDYFSGDRIICLLCGKSYKNLGVHLHHLHGVPPDEYRGMFGLPWSKGLVGQSSFEAYREAAMARPRDKFKPWWNDGKKEWPRHKHRKQPFQAEISRHNVRLATQANIGRYVDYGSEHWERFLDYIRKGVEPREIAKLEDMPSIGWYTVYQKRNPGSKEALLEALETWDFPSLAKIERLHESKRFMRLVKDLREQRCSDHKTASLLGVTAMPVHRFRAKHGII
ncbi:MAG: MucR family transcriptional regulator [Geminicoccaceae bacterium]